MCNQTLTSNIHFFVAKKTLPQLRRLYFILKERVFSSSSPFGYDTAELEEFYREELGTHMTMDSVSHPR